MREFNHRRCRIRGEFRACCAFFSSAGGQTSIEYGLMMSLIGGAILMGAMALGSGVATSMNNSATYIASAELSATGNPDDESEGAAARASFGSSNAGEAGKSEKRKNEPAGKSGIQNQLSSTTVTQSKHGKRH